MLKKKKNTVHVFSFVCSLLTVVRFSLLVIIHRSNLINIFYSNNTARPSSGEIFPSFIFMLTANACSFMRELRINQFY